MRNRDAIPVPARVVARLEALGVHMDRVWALLGLEAGQPPPMVTTETFFAFWRAVEEVTGRRDLGLVIGAESGRHGYSIATATALYAATLGEALETVARYKRIACPEDVDVEITRGEVSIRFHWILATTEAPRLLVDSAFASFASLARAGTDGKAAPARVELARRRASLALSPVSRRSW